MNIPDAADRLHHTKQWESEGFIDAIQKAADRAALAQGGGE